MCCNQFIAPLGNKPDCFSSAASCHESGRNFTIERKSAKETFCRITVDGCLLTVERQKRCDYVFIRCVNKDFFFVELKGNDIPQAVKQIIETIRYFRQRLNLPHENVYGYLSCKSIPSTIRNDWRILKKEFKEKWGVKLDNQTKVRI